MPPAVILGWELLAAPRTWRAWAVVACAVGQMYLSVYTGYLLGLLLTGGSVVSALLFRRDLPWRNSSDPVGGCGRGAAVAVGALALAPLLAKHARGVPPLP